MTEPNDPRTQPGVAFDHTDPGLRPFIEVEAKIAVEILDEERAAGSPARAIVAAVADGATQDAEVGARTMSDQLPSTRRLLPVCQEGCSYCCHQVVFASAPEILRIADHLKSTRTPEQLAELRTRVGETAARVKNLDLLERAELQEPCPLLDKATGRCGVYPVRPVACRAYHSGDVDTCKKAFDRKDAYPVIPINPALFHVAHAYGFGLMTGCEARGLDPGPYDLTVALPAALDADLSEAWLRGERVLPATTVSSAVRAGYEQTLGALSADLAAGRLDAAEKVASKVDPDAQRRERNRKKRERKGR